MPYRNERWATDAWKLGFRRNYAIAIALMLLALATKLFKGVTEGFGALPSCPLHTLTHDTVMPD